MATPRWFRENVQPCWHALSNQPRWNGASRRCSSERSPRRSASDRETNPASEPTQQSEKCKKSIAATWLGSQPAARRPTAARHPSAHPNHDAHRGDDHRDERRRRLSRGGRTASRSRRMVTIKSEITVCRQGLIRHRKSSTTPRLNPGRRRVGLAGARICVEMGHHPDHR